MYLGIISTYVCKIGKTYKCIIRQPVPLLPVRRGQSEAVPAACPGPQKHSHAFHWSVKHHQGIA